MNKQGPIIIIEDDEDDTYLLSSVFSSLGLPNQIKFFTSGDAAIEYLMGPDTAPFIIISDINMPKLSGLDLRKLLQSSEKMSVRCTPYIFFTTGADQNAAIESYSLSVQGFFIKPISYEGILEMVRSIVTYWQMAYSPAGAYRTSSSA